MKDKGIDLLIGGVVINGIEQIEYENSIKEDVKPFVQVTATLTLKQNEWEKFRKELDKTGYIILDRDAEIKWISTDEKSSEENTEEKGS